MNTYHAIVPAILAAFAMLAVSCATGDGDELDCPTCDNVAELLVGAKCVPIADVAACGPDGHSHGDECHCFNGQEPTLIGGTEYCLQQGCAGADGDTTVEDIDQHACEHLGDSPEAVQAVDVFDNFSQAHADRDTLALVRLPAGSVGYIHFPVDETGEIAVFADTAGVIDGFMDETGQTLNASNEGANSDCPDDFTEVWHVDIVNDSGSVQPRIIRFKVDVAQQVTLLILEAGSVHED